MDTFTFPNWSSQLALAVETLYLQLPKQDVQESTDPLLLARTNSEAIRKLMNELRNLVEPHEFKNPVEEIRFFKEVKPIFLASLIYWSQRFQLHLHQPVGGKGIFRKYWNAELQLLTRFFKEHIGFYEYLRSKDTRLDERYFLRCRSEMDEDPMCLDLNQRFTTARDHLVGKILAHDMLEQYILQILNSREHQAPVQKLQWTASKAGLVELIYALQSSGVYNNGKSEIKEIAETFQQWFRWTWAITTVCSMKSGSEKKAVPAF